MAENELTVIEDVPVDNWKVSLIIVGGLIGALVGVGSAYLLAQNMEKTGQRPQIMTRDGLELAVLLTATMRRVANLWQR